MRAARPSVQDFNGFFGVLVRATSGNPMPEITTNEFVSFQITTDVTRHVADRVEGLDLERVGPAPVWEHKAGPGSRIEPNVHVSKTGTLVHLAADAVKYANRLFVFSTGRPGPSCQDNAGELCGDAVFRAPTANRRARDTRAHYVNAHFVAGAHGQFF